MAQPTRGILNLAHAYRVLDVPWDASPRTIKLNYRKLVKRWHPDRHQPGTPGHTESTVMAKLLNEAYALIEGAPLRNGHATPFSSPAGRSASENASRAQAAAEQDPSGSSRSEYVARDPLEDVTEQYRMIENARAAGARDDAARPFDWIGFIVRFVIGAMFGTLLSFRVMTDLWLFQPKLIPVGIAATILFCALASGLGGDAFWRAIRPGGLWRRWD